jgi:UDP:flavonoid glycosyltransferase YjiC (YdhE family)
MRVLSSTYGSRGDAEPMVGLAVRLRALGAEVRACAPPDFAACPGARPSWSPRWSRDAMRWRRAA